MHKGTYLTLLADDGFPRYRLRVLHLGAQSSAVGEVLSAGACYLLEVHLLSCQEHLGQQGLTEARWFHTISQKSGIKLRGGQPCRGGSDIVRQRGTEFHPGEN